MPTSSLPLDIKSFLIENIDSVSHLEVLLMLYSRPQKKWTANDVSKELRSNVSSASNQLHTLHQKNLIQLNEDKTYQFNSSNEGLRAKVEQLTTLYHEKPVAIVTCIFDKPNEKLRTFADAFKIKKD